MGAHRRRSPRITQQQWFSMPRQNKEAIPGKAFSKFADRAFGNYNEQFALFMLAMWSHAFFVDPDMASYFGYLYVFLRLAYIIIWMLDSDVSKPKPDNIPAVTVPMYGI